VSTPAPILLYAGAGSSPNDVKAIEAILRDHGHTYATADAEQFNAMSAEQLAAHRLLIVPGGNYIEMGQALTDDAAVRVRDAVHGGLNYLGICAGALIAGKATTRSFNLTDGVHFDFYAAVNQNIHKTVLPVAVAGGETLELYWEDGPQLSGWGEPIARYPDGTPAVAQGAAGEGWGVLCGVHPEAPESWREGMDYTTPASAGHEYAAELIEAALRQRSLAPGSAGASPSL
jgi:glutamine amidotransferase-like uncharacterized protein